MCVVPLFTGFPSGWCGLNTTNSVRGGGEEEHGKKEKGGVASSA